MARSKRLTKEEIKQDKFIEGILLTFEFLKENLRTILIAVTTVVVVVGGVFAYQRHQQDQRAQASFALVKASKKYQEAENSWLDPEKTDESTTQLQTASTELQTVFEKYPNTAFADKARYDYAKTLYLDGNYQGARDEFKSIIANHKPENQILALYAQKAIGECYEQEGNYEEAIKAYQSDKFPQNPQIPEAVRQAVIANAKFSQALCHEKVGRSNEALALYKDLVDLFRENLEQAIQQKSLELLPRAKTLISKLPEPLTVTEAKKLEDENRYYEAFTAYAGAIHRYKVEKDIQGGLSSTLREQIQKFEKTADAFLKSLQDAKRYDSEGRTSTALYYYGQAVGLDFAPSRSLYEKALLQRDHLLAQK